MTDTEINYYFFSYFFPTRTLLQFAKKKRKRSDSGSDLDLDVTPPPSPKDDEIIEKRRSGRNTNKRKKYVGDVDSNLSDEEHLLMPNLPGATRLPRPGRARPPAPPPHAVRRPGWPPRARRRPQRTAG